MNSSPTAPAATGGRGGATYLLVILTLVNTINWADRQVLPILFPAIKADLGLSDTQLGIIGGIAFFAIYALMAFLFGYLADRRIRRNIITFGLVLWSLATAAGGLANGFWGLFTARFFTGLGEATLYPCAMSLLGERFPAEGRGKAMGIFGAAAAIGSGLGLILGGWLAKVVGWREAFFMFGAAGLFLVPAMMSVVESVRPEPKEKGMEIFGVIGDLLRDTRLLVIWASGAVMIAAGLGYASWAPTYFARIHGFDMAQAGMLFGAAALVGGILGSVLGGTFADRRKKARVGGELDVSMVTALVAAPLVAVVVFGSWMPLLIVCGLLGPVAIFAYFPCLQAIMIDVVPPERHGIAYAVLILFMGGIGSSLGPIVVGGASDVAVAMGWAPDAAAGLRIALVLPIIAMLLASVMALAAGNLIRRQARDAAGATAGPGAR